MINITSDSELMAQDLLAVLDNFGAESEDGIAALILAIKDLSTFTSDPDQTLENAAELLVDGRA